MAVFDGYVAVFDETGMWASQAALGWACNGQGVITLQAM